VTVCNVLLHLKMVGGGFLHVCRHLERIYNYFVAKRGQFMISALNLAVVCIHWSANSRARKVDGVDMHVLFLAGSARVL
jgi:hypothetical protein